MAHSITDEMAALRRRVEALEAEREILRVLHSYGPALDYGDESGFLDCFTEVGVFEIRGHPHLTKFEGKEELRAFAAQQPRAPVNIHKHCVLDPLIAVDGNQATSVSYFVRLNREESGPLVHVFGRYFDDLVRDDDHRWRFLRRVCQIEAIR